MHFSRWCLKIFYLCIFVWYTCSICTCLYLYEDKHACSSKVFYACEDYRSIFHVFLCCFPHYILRQSHLNQSFTDLSSLATQMPSSTLHLSGGGEDLNSFQMKVLPVTELLPTEPAAVHFCCCCCWKWSRYIAVSLLLFNYRLQLVTELLSHSTLN